MDFVCDICSCIGNSLTELSEKLGVKVCVEGVETREQLETLKKMKVAFIQGYLYGKPVPYREFERTFLGINRFEEHMELVDDSLKTI